MRDYSKDKSDEIYSKAGFTVDELIEALQKLPSDIRKLKASHDNDCQSCYIYRVSVWDDGVELS